MATEEISLLKLFERLVSVEAKFDIQRTENLKTRHRFELFVYILIFLTVTNILVHALGFLL